MTHKCLTTWHWPILAATLLGAALGGACAPSLPAPYVMRVTQAKAAYSEGHHRAAAHHWEAAALEAPNENHRAEARYRQATSLLRAGDLVAARKLFIELASRPSPRQARAAFDLAYLMVNSEEAEAGHRLLESLVVKYPNAGNARRALQVLLAHKRNTLGPDTELEWLKKLSKQVSGSELEQTVLFIQATRLQESHSDEAALRAYQDLALRFPYPAGAYWDEAILKAARIEVHLGRPKAALQRLSLMLREREAPVLVGSYERRFAEAHYLIAEIYQNQLGDWIRARREFRVVATKYSTSLLRDDALWQAILLSQKHGDQNAACDDARQLASSLPESRFAGCSAHFCEQPAPGANRCPPYAVAQALQAGRREATPQHSN